MQECVTRPDPFRARLMLQDTMVQITSGDFPDLVLGAHDDRKLFRLVFLPPGAISDEGREESGEPESFVPAD